MKQKQPSSRAFMYVAGAVLAAGIIALLAGMIQISRLGMQVKAYVGEFIPDASSMPNGSYSGSYELSETQTGAAVSFTVRDGHVSSLRVDKLFHTPLYPAARRIKEHVESVKNLTFDAVTGATISSLFVRAAIKNAVANGQVLKIPD